MRYAESRYGEDPIAVGIFEEGASGVTIKVLDLSTDSLLNLSTSGCTESSVVSGFFTWDAANFVTKPTDFNQLLYIMEDTDGRQHPGKFLIGGYTSDSAVRRFGGKVWIDVDNGVSGTTFPNGTETKPVSGLADAGVIGANENLPAYNVKGDLTLTSGHTNWSFEGVEPLDDTVTVSSGVVTSGCQFTKLGIRGRMDGRITAQNCTLSTAGGHLYDVWGLFENCGAQGTIHVAANSLFQALSFASQSLIPGTILDMGNGGANIMLLLGQATGIYQLSNMAAGFVGISMAGGQLQINATCTAGLIFLFGHGRLIDNSDGATIFNYMMDPTELDEIATIGDTLDVVSGDLATHNAALAAHDLVLDAVSGDLATHVAALIDHALDLDAVSGDLATHNATLDVVSADVAAVDAAVANVDSDLVAHDAKLDGHITALAAHDATLDVVSADVLNLDGDLVAHDAKLVDHAADLDVVSADLLTHVGQLTTHDAALAAHDVVLDAVSADVAALDTSGIAPMATVLDVVSADLLTHVGQLTTHDAALTAHDATLDAVSADVAALDLTTLETTLDVVSADLAAHDTKLDGHVTALATHDGKLDNVDADLVLHDAKLDGHITALATHDAALTTHDAALTAHDSKLDTVEGKVDNVDADLVTHNAALTAHDGKLDVVAGDVERNYGRNTRTRLYYATALISGATRVVPEGAASHMQTQVKTDAQADWTSATTFYVWFNYADTATSGSAPGAAEPNTAAPTDGSFRADGWPA